jgi:hypothetical protein|tara:strand:+ start:98 stop:625 length:528 start_codon:yes stop_codon:yes gene_type:complete
MDDSQILVSFTLQTALPAEEMYVGGPHYPQGAENNDNNIFYMTGQTLYDLKRSFPLQGTYHFRCLSATGDFWIDLVSEQDDLIVQADNTIQLKVLDVTALYCVPTPEMTYKEEVQRIEEIEEARQNRPYCLTPSMNTEDERDSTGSVSSQAKQAAKSGMAKASKFASKVKGFFRS